MPTPIETVFSALEAHDCRPRKSGAGYSARCPAHADARPSLSVSEGEDGRVLLKCFAGCEFKDIAAALGLAESDFFLPKAESLQPLPHRSAGKQNPAPERSRRQTMKTSLTLAELAADKRLPLELLKDLGLCENRSGVHIPYRLADGSTACRQRIRTALVAKDGSRWERGAEPVVPYGLWRLQEVKEGGRLILCEGESDAWTLWFHNLPALGLPGCDFAGKLQAEYLQGISRIYVVHEPDKGGATFIDRVEARLNSLHYAGEAFELTMPDGAKDPNELHKRLYAKPGAFLEAFEAVINNAPHIGSRRTEGEPLLSDCGQFFESEEGTFMRQGSMDRPAVKHLTNWRARIVENILVCENGCNENDNERSGRRLRVTAYFRGQSRTTRLLTLNEFKSCSSWIFGLYGSDAWVASTHGSEASITLAIQRFSEGAPQKTVFMHTGWARLNGNYAYLSDSGATGEAGLNAECTVQLDGNLSAYRLPAPPAGDNLLKATGAIMRLAEITPDGAAGYALIAAIGRALLGACTAVLYIFGVSGTRKSALAGLAQAAFGSDFYKDGLSPSFPASFADTANAIREKAHLVHDAVFVVDDYAPGAGRNARQELESKLEAVIRSAGNTQGRARLTKTSALQSDRAPQGLIIITGEEKPLSHSLTGRSFLLELRSGDIDLNRLSECQTAAAEGVLAQFTAALAQWLAAPGRLESEKRRLGLCQKLERKKSFEGGHGRTKDNLAQFLAGLELVKIFITEKAGHAETDAWHKRGIEALRRASDKQIFIAGESRPDRIFINALQEALESGRCHLTAKSGGKPEHASRFGWRDCETPQGPRIGYIDEFKDKLYLIPGAALSVAKKQAEDSNSALTASVTAMGSLLLASGLIMEHEKERSTKKVQSDYGRSNYWVLPLSLLAGSETQQTDDDCRWQDNESDACLSGF